MNAVSKWTLVILATVALALFAFAESRTVVVNTRWHDEKIAAVSLTDSALAALAQAAADSGVPLDPINDPRGSGIVGPEFTPISTDRGVLAAKLTVTNPNFAAAVVDMLKEAGLKPGDPVAVAFTGSFPGANVAVLAACETLKLKPLAITSIGASSFGATGATWTWLDMEHVLVSRGIFKTRSIAASTGGGKDRGRGLSEDGRDLIREAATRNATPFLEDETLDAAIRRRITLYDSAAAILPGRTVRAFINVGGGLAALGASVNGRLLPNGLITHLAHQNFPARGALIQFADRGLPVVNLTEMENVARRYRLPLDPGAFGEIGAGPAFAETRYDTALSALALAILLVITIAAIRVDLTHKWRARRNGDDAAFL